MIRTIITILSLLLLGAQSETSPYTAAFAPTPFAQMRTTPTPRRTSPTPRPANPGPLVPDTATARLVADSTTPKADQFSITQRLRLHSSKPIPRTVDKGNATYAVGSKQVFWVSDIVAKRYYTITGTLVAVSDHAYMYVQDGYKVNNAAVKQALDTFERDIYPTNREYFGSEPNPGVDNDPRFTILNTEISGAGGYFSATDAYPKAITRFSNEQEMIYIGTNPAQTEYYLGTIAHEYQHMIHFNENPDQSVWLNEGASELAMFLNGYDVGGTDYVFQLNPDVQLNGWASDPSASVGHYGAAYLFLRYTANLYGPEFMKSLNESKVAGPASVDYALKQVGPRTILGATCGTDFNTTFKFWVAANIINKYRTADPCYGYDDPDINIQKVRTVGKAEQIKATLHQYAATYYDLSAGKDAVTVNFSGATGVPVISNRPASGRYQWWSNRDDSMDSTLTRAFDLTKAGGKIALNFSTWYDLERDYDYAYVLASADNGQTWQTLPATNTTNKDPNGTNYGNAFTGVSGRTDEDATKGVWQPQTVDLSKFAGKKVLLRFECITDQAYNAQGMAIDDIRIDAIGFRDDAETSAGGWQAEGWLRIASAMPQQFYVQVVKIMADNTVQVQDVPLNASNQGSITLSGLTGDVERALVIVAPYAPKTSVQATYTIEFK